MVFNRLFLKARDALVPDFGALITAGMLVATGACAVLIHSNAKLRSSEATEWRRYEHLAQLQKFRDNLHDLDRSVLSHLLNSGTESKDAYRENARMLHSRLDAIYRISFTAHQRETATYVQKDLSAALKVTDSYMASSSGGTAPANSYQTDYKLRAVIAGIDRSTNELTSQDEQMLAVERLQVARWFGHVQMSFLLTLLCGSFMFVLTACRLKAESKKRQQAERVEHKTRRRLATAHDLIEWLGRKGVMNRVLERDAFLEFSVRELDRAIKSEEPLSMVTFGVDDAMRIAEHIGDQGADKLFAGMAKMLLGVVRCGDVVGRLAPDRMAVLLPGLDLETSNHVADRLRKSVSDADWNGIKITLSAGVAQADIRHDVREMLSRSERALLFAKTSGNTAQAIRAHLPMVA